MIAVGECEWEPSGSDVLDAIDALGRVVADAAESRELTWKIDLENQTYRSQIEALLILRNEAVRVADQVDDEDFHEAIVLADKEMARGERGAEVSQATEAKVQVPDDVEVMKRG